MYNFSNVPLYDLEVSAWLMRSVNSGEWGDDLPPHPSPSDGHGKLVPDSAGGGATNGVMDRAGTELPQNGD